MGIGLGSSLDVALFSVGTSENGREGKFMQGVVKFLNSARENALACEISTVDELWEWAAKFS